MKIFISNKKILKSLILTALVILVLVAGGCDFEGPADFKTPTWFMDLTIPLIDERYPLAGIVDSTQIFITPDSLGMQVVFGDTLDRVGIDESYLEVKLNQDDSFTQDPVYLPDMEFVFDTLISVEVPFAPNNQFLDVNGQTFTVPSVSDRQILAQLWNNIATNFDTTVSIDIDIPQVDDSDLPEFISSIDAIVITADTGTDSSVFLTSLTNNGCPTNVRDVEFSLVTDLTSPDDTLASHTQNQVVKDAAFSENTSIGDKKLGSTIRMTFGFGLETTTLDTLTINAGDSVKVNLSFRIRIAGVDEAIVQVSEYDLSPDLPAVEFPSDIQIYSGVFRDPTWDPGVNEIIISNLQSTYLFDINFKVKFSNFMPPAGEDSVMIETVLSQDSSVYSRTFDIDGYTFANPISADSALEEMVLEVTAVIPAQEATIPLDGSEFGSMSMRTQVKELQFESLEAKLIEEFPPSEQEISGMPSGFSGMAFTDVNIKFIVINYIQLPVSIDMDMIGIDIYGDSTKVRVQSQIGEAQNSVDSVRTEIVLDRDGTTTTIYEPNSDSEVDTVIFYGASGSTIVDLLSSNPENLVVNSAAKIDGRGEIVAGATIGFSFELVAPFEVRMAPMTFIPVNESPLEEWSFDVRNKIRSGLKSATAVARVVNHFPTGGEISILLSNQSSFPLDLSQKNLDSMAVKLGIDITSGDHLYAVNECSSLDPALNGADSSIYIFNVMSDFSECVDGVTYIVRSTANVSDTVVAYVDTLLSITLPDPQLINYDSENDDRRLVDTPGDLVSSSIIDPDKIYLMTSTGEHFTTPRFHLNGSPIDPITGDTLPVFISIDDYVEIQSFITFEISSTGIMESAPPELVLSHPNGGDSLNAIDPIIIRWRTFGKISSVNLDYSSTTSPDVEDDLDWTPILDDWTSIANVDSFIWDASSIISDIPEAQRDSVRIRVSAANSDARDMSGWYFTLYESLNGKARKQNEYSVSAKFSGGRK